MNSGDQKPSSSAATAVEVRRLLEENARLRSLLIAHSIPIPQAAQPTLHPPQALNAAPVPLVECAARLLKNGPNVCHLSSYNRECGQARSHALRRESMKDGKGDRS